ncbi:MAG: hypothetical protein IIA27_17010, partial [Gemmatimonadetes bacterium]|nr:hypothetical protein [Gemmatimonadota bacterium]
ISVDLTTKVTAIDRITVLFTADAPTAEDLTGVEFLSTVDDSSTTGDAPQPTIEGNADGDAGDNNSWTVTTTNSATGALSRWTLDETSGTVAADVEAFHDGTYTNGVTLNQAGACPNTATAVYFDGETSGQYIVIPHHDDYLLDNGTISLWANIDALPNPGAEPEHGLFSKDSNGTDTGGHVDIKVLTDGTIEARLQSATASNLVTGAAITATNWFHLAFSWGAGGMKLYIDGGAPVTDPYTGGLGTTSGGIGNFEAIILGASQFTSDPDLGITPLRRWMKGYLDDVRIYDRELSLAEIQALADCANAPAVTSAVAEISPNDVATNSTGNTFEYEIGATIDSGDTGVDRVVITVPGSFTVPASPVFNVLVDGVTVAFTDNTVGNAISVDLTTKVTTTSQISVLFDADAPTSQDLIGADFLSTVDDSTTGYAPQAATEGNGDGDAGDANSWTVTTTGASTGTLSRWRLNETSGTVAADTNASHDGTYSNGVTLNQAGACTNTATAVHFNGETGGQYVVIPHHDDYLLDNGTISLWANIDMLPNTDSEPEHALFSKDSTGFDTGGHVDIRVLSGGTIEVRMQSATTSYLVTGTAITATEWFHLAFSWGAGGMKLYIDGTLAATDPYTGGLGTTSGGIGNYEAIVLGASQFTSDPDFGITPLRRWMQGYLDDVRIYDSALDLAEIQAIAACAGTPAVTSTLAEITPNDVTTSSTANAFSYDIQATISGGDTGVDRVTITVPANFTTVSVT